MNGPLFSISVRTCVRPNVPKDGEMKCYHPDLGITYDNDEMNLPMDAECTFKCPAGKYVSGSKLRICLPLALWDGLNTSCRRKKITFWNIKFWLSNF